MVFDYSEMVKIDPFSLDKEWQQQAAYTLFCMEALALARKEYDKQKEELELITAEVDKEIRETADKKPSEKAIEGMVLLDSRVQQAKKSLIDCRYNVNMLEAARAGLDNKRDALTNLVKLHGMGYFAEPDADIEARGELDEMRQEAIVKKVKINKANNTPQIRRKK